MSIQTEITRISNAKDSIKTAIGNKGVTVPSATKLVGCAALVDQIDTARYETLTVTCSTDQAGVSAAGQVLTINGVDYTVPSNGVVTATIQEGITYHIVANDKAGYDTPSSRVYIAEYGSRSITMQWKLLVYGIYILYTDGSTSNYDTLTSGKTPVGVVLKNEYVSFVLHPKQFDVSETRSIKWSSNITTVIGGVTTTTNYGVASSDYAGLANTNAVIASGLAGSAFTLARNVAYADGRTGYLPAAGEYVQIFLNMDNINVALNLIGGDELYEPEYFEEQWSSTQYNKQYAWMMYRQSGEWVEFEEKDVDTALCRSVAPF